MSQTIACPECGARVPADAPGGLCPRCLMGAATAATRLERPAPPPGPADAPAFIRAIRELDLVPAPDLEPLAAAAGDDPTRLARILVQAKKLTAYQAGAVLQGKARGLVIGSYLVAERLGVGGMGVVFKAEHRPSGRLVALKILPPSFGREPETVRRFRREFQVASRLSHPNLVAAVEASEDRGVHYLTMEYIPGYDLDRLVSQGGPMAVKLALHCAIQAARGLEAAHAQGVVHRDVKPGNIMIDPAGSVRVLDLGLARVIEATTGFGRTAPGTLTQTGSYMGTVDFLAPEQADNAKAADARADVYSLACTLYYLLAAKPPFPGGTVLQRLMAHQQRPAPSLRAARPEVSEPLEAIFIKMMSKRPGDRPQNMSEVVAGLEACRTSAREAGDASADLKTFARTVLKRAPDRKRRGPDASVFSREKPSPGGLALDPDLRFEDLVGDYRDQVPTPEIPEDRLPPIVSRPLTTKVRRRRSNTPYALLGLGLLGLAAALYSLRPRVTANPTAPETALTTAEPAAVSPSRPAPTLVADHAPPSNGFQPLFNGKDLTGWTTHPSQPGNWSVENGLLVGRGPQVSHLYTEREDLGDVEIRVEARINEGGNSGIFARTQFGPVMPATAPVYVSGYEAQIDSTVRPQYPQKTGSLYDQSLKRVATVSERLVLPGAWFTMSMTLQGSRVRVTVDGREVVDYSDPQPAQQRGRIALQVNEPETVVEFRKIEVRDLAPGASRLAAPLESGSPASPTPGPRLGRTIYNDDFDGPTGKLTAGVAEMGEGLAPNITGYERGSFFMLNQGNWMGAGNSEVILDPQPAPFQIEVTGRVLGGSPEAVGSWGFVVGRDDGRGLHVQIDRKGALTLSPPHWSVERFPDDPRLGPISHPAIRPGDQFNKLALRVENRRVEVLVNGTRVADNIALEYDMLPAGAVFMIVKPDFGTIIRAEYDRIEVREFFPADPLAASPPPPPPQVADRILLSEDFNVHNNAWQQSTPEEVAKRVDGEHGFADGVWYCISRGFAGWGWSVPGGVRPASETEVAVRVVGDGAADPRGGALVHLETQVPGEDGDRAFRAIQVRIDGAGRLSIEASILTAKAYPDGPWAGPISHPALRPAGQTNVLRFRVRKRTLEIFANGEKIGDPITFDWDLTPMSVSLGADSWSGAVRAEFDRIVIRAIEP